MRRRPTRPAPARFFRPAAALIALLAVLSAALPAARPATAQAQLAQAQQEKTPIKATDLFKIRELQDVAVAPGGRSVVYTVKRVVEQPADSSRADSTGGPAYRTHLWLADAGGRAAPRPLTSGLQSAHSPAWHPDGDRLAFVREVDGTPQVFVLPLAASGAPGTPRQVTDAEHGAGAPAFSPGGRRLLFGSKLPAEAVREAIGTPPPWASERPGGQGYGDALRGTDPDPDGDPYQVQAYLEQERPGRPHVTSRLDFQGERALEPRPTFRHLFVVDLRLASLDSSSADSSPTDSAATVPAATRITDGYYHFEGGSWMPDGRHVVVSGPPAGMRTHPDRVRDRDLFAAGVFSAGQVPLLSMDGHALTAPRVSPEGGHVAFRAARLSHAGYAQNDLGLARLTAGDGGAPALSGARLLTEDFDRSTGAPTWSPDGWRLYTTAASEGAFPLYRLSPFTGRRPPTGLPPDSTTDSTQAAASSPSPSTAPAIQRLTGPRQGVRSFDVSRGTLFYVATQPENPFELYAASGTGADGTPRRERRLTRHNAAWLEARVLSVPRPFTVRSDSFVVQGWTMRPTTQRKGDPAPLLVEIHGGPAAMWGPGEATMWHEFQYFAARGYAVVFANPRGSGGYGRAFKRANRRDWGRGPTRDVLAAADYAAALPWADANRQLVTGGSYAGYLTAWIVAHTDRFQAAVAQRGVYDLSTFFGEGNAWRLVPWHFGGFPWEGAPVAEAGALGKNAPAEDALAGSGPPEAGGRADEPSFASAREALIRNSPITYVDQIRTPLLIMHASEDLRTGVSQSEMLYRSLKALNRPVEYARYPDAGHDLSRTGDPTQRLDRLLRIWSFFERYI